MDSMAWSAEYKLFAYSMFAKSAPMAMEIENIESNSPVKIS